MIRPYDDHAGDWQGLDSAAQDPRYATIAEMLRCCQADIRVLDVGCGEALLRPWLPRETNYIGIEASSLAAAKALERDPSLRIIHATAEEFAGTDEPFSSIVFNEMLYYAVDPVRLVKRYSTMLTDGGAILCSVYQAIGRPSFGRGLRHLIDRRLPISNVHCEKMLRTYMAHHSWTIVDDREVQLQDTSTGWHVWLARPNTNVAHPER